MSIQNIIYKPITGWKQGTIEEQDSNGNRIVKAEEKDSKGNRIVKLVIGEVKEQRQLKDYLVEDMYKVILDNMLENPSLYKVDVKLGMNPRLLITCEGRLLLYNDTVKQYHKTITDILSELPKEDICLAYKELRLNMGAKHKLGPAFEHVSYLIRKESGAPISSTFIREMIFEYIEKRIFDSKGVEQKEYLKSLSYEELIEYTGHVFLYELDGVIKDEFLLDLCEGKEEEKTRIMKSFKIDLEHELFLRFTKGMLVER